MPSCSLAFFLLSLFDGRLARRYAMNCHQMMPFLMQLKATRIKIKKQVDTLKNQWKTMKAKTTKGAPAADGKKRRETKIIEGDRVAR